MRIHVLKDVLLQKLDEATLAFLEFETFKIAAKFINPSLHGPGNTYMWPLTIIYAIYVLQ